MIRAMNRLRRSFRDRSARPRRRAMAPAFETLEQRTLFSLLGLSPGLPVMSFDSTGVMAYSAASEQVSLTATPLSYLDGVNFAVVQNNPTLALHANVDHQGNLLPGSGNTFSVTGDIDLDGNGSPDYSGTLLTGQVTAFGYQDAGAVDAFDFRVRITGGELAGAYFGQDLDVEVTSENSTFTDFNSDSAGHAKGTFGAVPPSKEQVVPSSISGTIYNDCNDTGAVDAGEALLAGVPVTLTGTDNVTNQPISLTTTTDNNGDYSFANLNPGTYTITRGDVAGYLDGKETAGSLDGTVDNTRDSTVISAVNLTAGTDATGYDFGLLHPSSLAGSVYVDNNFNKQFDALDAALPSTTLTLTGTDDRGTAIAPVVVQTDASGSYSFTDLRPGNYTITETLPAGYASVVLIPGDVAGAAASGPNSFALSIVGCGTVGVGFDFAEQPFTCTPPPTCNNGGWSNSCNTHSDCGGDHDGGWSNSCNSDSWCDYSNRDCGTTHHDSNRDCGDRNDNWSSSCNTNSQHDSSRDCYGSRDNDYCGSDRNDCWTSNCNTNSYCDNSHNSYSSNCNTNSYCGNNDSHNSYSSSCNTDSYRDNSRNSYSSNCNTNSYCGSNDSRNSYSSSCNTSSYGGSSNNNSYGGNSYSSSCNTYTGGGSRNSYCR